MCNHVSAAAMDADHEEALAGKRVGDAVAIQAHAGDDENAGHGHAGYRPLAYRSGHGPAMAAHDCGEVTGLHDPRTSARDRDAITADATRTESKTGRRIVWARWREVNRSGDSTVAQMRA